MIIELNKEWQVVLDRYGNYTPYRWTVVEAGKPLLTKGKVTKYSEGYVSQLKYFSSLYPAVKWIAQEEMTQQAYSFVEFLDHFEANLQALYVDFKVKNPYVES